MKVLFCLMATVILSFTFAPSITAQESTSSSTSLDTGHAVVHAQNIDPTDPVTDVRTNMRWEFGPIFNWGTGVGDRSDFKFVWSGFQLGKPLTPVLGHGFLAGQFELGGNINPLWLGFTPDPHTQTYEAGGETFTQQIGGGTFHGVSMTPVILRWNFLTHSRRIQPWFQGAGGLIYTTHKFPPDILVPHGEPGGTSVWNFAPQGGIGVHIFTRARRSIDIGVNAVHISSASLGDKNPGVNASMQFQVGYTFWK
jgi:hypothetical protein